MISCAALAMSPGALDEPLHGKRPGSEPRRDREDQDQRALARDQPGEHDVVVDVVPGRAVEPPVAGDQAQGRPTGLPVDELGREVCLGYRSRPDDGEPKPPPPLRSDLDDVTASQRSKSIEGAWAALRVDMSQDHRGPGLAGLGTGSEPADLREALRHLNRSVAI